MPDHHLTLKCAGWAECAGRSTGRCAQNEPPKKWARTNTPGPASTAQNGRRARPSLVDQTFVAHVVVTTYSTLQHTRRYIFFASIFDRPKKLTVQRVSRNYGDVLPPLIFFVGFGQKSTSKRRATSVFQRERHIVRPAHQIAQPTTPSRASRSKLSNGTPCLRQVDLVFFWCALQILRIACGMTTKCARCFPPPRCSP